MALGRGGLPLSRPSQCDEDRADVAENLAFWAGFLGGEAGAVEDALEKVGLGGLGHLPFGYLSTGQKRRAAIARLLLCRRPLWLLDEPTAGLDARSEEEFAELANAHLRRRRHRDCRDASGAGDRGCARETGFGSAA